VSSRAEQEAEPRDLDRGKKPRARCEHAELFRAKKSEQLVGAIHESPAIREQRSVCAQTMKSEQLVGASIARPPLAKPHPFPHLEKSDFPIFSFSGRF
jgi:hypothetical protein